MTYLLDVNALIALVHEVHEHHARVRKWLASLQKKEKPTLATCAITELGFLRVSVQSRLLPDVGSARSVLAALKSSKGAGFEMMNDDLGADHLPEYVDTPGQITDGHLLELASKHKARLVTLDSGIPGALLIE